MAFFIYCTCVSECWYSWTYVRTYVWYVFCMSVCACLYVLCVLSYAGLHKYQQRGMQQLQCSLYEFPSIGTGKGQSQNWSHILHKKFTLIKPCKDNSLGWWSPFMLIVTHTITQHINMSTPHTYMDTTQGTFYVFSFNLSCTKHQTVQTHVCTYVSMHVRTYTPLTSLGSNVTGFGHLLGPDQNGCPSLVL